MVERLPAAPAAWRARCAQTLSEADPDHALPLLLTLLQDEDPDVTEAAADSLASLAQDGATPTLDEVSRAALARLVARGGLAAGPAQRLLAHP
nr:HEAT repeat domain-containing protein [Cellulomonas sp. APG4]